MTHRHRDAFRPSPLRATRRALPDALPIDPYDLAGEEGTVFDTGDRVLVGLGRALVLPLPHGLGATGEAARAVERLRAVDCDGDLDRFGAGVVAFAALPFDRHEPGALIVPDVAYCREADGSAWATVVAGAGIPSETAALRTWLEHRCRPRARPRSGPLPMTGGGGTSLPALPHLAEDAGFVGMVEAALDRIGRGELEKVVLSRHVEARLDPELDLPGLLRRWRALEPSCTVFSLPVRGGRFVGASPELLVRRQGTHVVSRPLAGTSGPAVGEQEPLLSSAKDATEHQLVVEAIGALLGRYCTELEVPPRPDLVHLHSVSHLGTTITGTLRNEGDTVPSALDLVALLHPTPAVGGVPTTEALATIAKLERRPRGPYAGPVGYVDATGDGEWVVGIRAALLSGGIARLTAGVGIVDGSDPDAELDETTLKLMAVVDALADQTSARRAG